MNSSTTPLFSLVIPPCGPYPEGKLVCTEAGADEGSHIYVLTLTVQPDNRLTTPVCDALVKALDILEFAHPPGVVVTTSGIQKFYSNGLDLGHATETPGFWSGSLYRMWMRFLTYPTPTIALINGHAFAGGLMTAMHHDYRIFNPTRGFLCLNELEFGAPLKPPMSGIFRIKTSPQTYRDLVLEAKRFPGPAALKAGLVDALGDMREVLDLVKSKGLSEKGKTGVYGRLKAEMYRENIAFLKGFEKSEEEDGDDAEKEEMRKREGKKWVEDWEGGNGRGSKL